MEVRIVREPISMRVVQEAAADGFGDMVKAVVDVGRGVLALGGELHADGEAVLLSDGSQQHDLWGINLYPDRPSNEWIEFQSLINVRPGRGNRSLQVESAEVRSKITEIISRLIPR